MADHTFAKGVYVELPSGKTPAWIKYRASFKIKEFIDFLNNHGNEAGYVNLDLKESRDGKPYFELNDFKKADKVANTEEEALAKHDSVKKPVKVEPPIVYPQEDINPEDIPF